MGDLSSSSDAMLFGVCPGTRGPSKMADAAEVITDAVDAVADAFDDVYDDMYMNMKSYVKSQLVSTLIPYGARPHTLLVTSAQARC